MMKLLQLPLSILTLGLLFVLSGCGGDNDPILKEINERLEIDIDDFELSVNSVQPNNNLRIRWEASGAVLFDANVYLSNDSRLSAEDVLVISEDCGPDGGDHCEAGRRVEFDCLYRSDNTFDCEEDDDVISTNDLTPFLDTIPKDAFVILELCNDGKCDTRALAVTFL